MFFSLCFSYIQSVIFYSCHLVALYGEEDLYNALKNNDEKDDGIKQTWLFAHPDNKKVTGPYERFRIMIYGEQYRHLINHSSHKIDLLTNSPNTFIYKIEILSLDKKLFFYEWHVQKGNENDCKNCWFTTAVSQPVDQGNTI